MFQLSPRCLIEFVLSDLDLSHNGNEPYNTSHKFQCQGLERRFSTLRVGYKHWIQSSAQSESLTNSLSDFKAYIVLKIPLSS